MNPANNEIRIVKDITSGKWGTSVVYDDGDSTRFDSDKPDATITKLPDGTPVSPSKTPTRQKNADDYAAQQKKIKDFNEAKAAEIQAAIEESTSNYAVPNVVGFENGHKVFEGHDGGRWVWSDDLPMGGKGWVHKGEDDVVTSQIKDSQASGYQGYYSVTMLDGKDKFDANAQYEVGGYEPGHIIYSINEAVSGANAVLDGKRADSAKISAPETPAKSDEDGNLKRVQDLSNELEDVIDEVKTALAPSSGLSTKDADSLTAMKQALGEALDTLREAAQAYTNGDDEEGDKLVQSAESNLALSAPEYDMTSKRTKRAGEVYDSLINNLNEYINERDAAKMGEVTPAAEPTAEPTLNEPVTPKAAPKNPPTKKQKEMIRSMLRERAMSSEQRQEYMDRLAASEKSEISDLFNELKALPKAKVAFTDLTDPLNFHEDDNLATIKQQIAPFDLDGSIRRFIDEKTANGGEISAAEIREKLDAIPDWKNSGPGKYGEYENEKMLANMYISKQKTSEEMQASEAAKEKAAEEKKALESKLDALKQGQADLTATSAEEHQAKLEELAALISDENDPNHEVRNGILNGDLRTGDEIVAALRKQQVKNQYKNLVDTKFSTGYKYIASDESKNPEEWAIINAAYNLPPAPEGFDGQFMANELSGYDNDNGDLATLINSGASGSQILDWLRENSASWKNREGDYDTRMYVDLPWPTQKAAWKKTGELISKIAAFNGVEEEPGTPANVGFVDNVSERLPQGHIQTVEAELGNVFNGESLSQLLGKVNNEEDLQRVVDEIATVRATKTDLTESQDTRLEMVLDATIKTFYQNKKDLKNVIDEPANIVLPAETEPETPKLTISELFSSLEDLSDFEGGYPDSLYEQVDEIQEGADKIEVLKEDIADLLEAGDAEGAAKKYAELAYAYDYFANQVELARELGADAFDDPDFKKKDQDKVIADYQKAAALARDLAAAGPASPEPQPEPEPESEPASDGFGVADSYEIGDTVEVNYDPEDTGIGFVRSGKVINSDTASGEYLVEVDNVSSNGESAGKKIAVNKKDMRVAEDVLDAEVDEDVEVEDGPIENPFSTANSDKLLTETNATREEIDELDSNIAAILDVSNAQYEYTPMLKGITGNSHVVKNLLDNLDSTDGANNIAIAGDLYSLHDVLVQQGTDPAITERLMEIANALDDFIPAMGDGEGSNAVTVETITQEQASKLDLSKWKKVGGQKGSNPGGTYENPETGEQVYVKTPKSQLHGENERLAAALYEAAGISSAKVLAGKDANGNDVTYSPMIDGATPNLKKKLTDKEYMARLQQGFAMDALLGNWDVIGLDFDNVVTDANGEPVRVDPGGALLFRAQGSPKGDAFGEDVPELEAFTDKTSTRPSAKVFSQMTDAQKLESAKVLQNLSPSQIDELVNSIITDPAKREELKKKLKARREFILNSFGLGNTGNDGGNGGQEPSPSPEAPSAPSTPDETGTLALGDDQIRMAAASAVQGQLPAGYTVVHDKLKGNSGGSIMVRNSQDTTVAMLVGDPDEPGKFAVQDFKGGWTITKHDSLSEGMSKLAEVVNAIENPTKPATPVTKKPVEVTIAGPKLSDGSTGGIGAKVVHTGTGEKGTIVKFDKNPAYVVVKGEDGKLKTKSVNKLKAAGDGGTPAPSSEAPNAPSAPENAVEPEAFAPQKSENMTLFTAKNGDFAKVSVIKTFEGKWDVVYDYGGPDFKALDVDIASREEAEAKALISLGTNNFESAISKLGSKKKSEEPAEPTGPKKFTFDFTSLADVQDAPEIDENDPDELPGEQSKIKKDSTGTLIKPGAIVTDENGRVGVYRTTGYGDPNKIRMIWEDGTQDSVMPDTVTATGKYLTPGIAAMYAQLAPLDFEKNAVPMPDNHTSSIKDKSGKSIGHSQLVIDKNGDLGVVVEMGYDGYIKVAYPDGTKKRKADTLTALDLRYGGANTSTQNVYSIKNAQKQYKALSNYSAKYNLPTFGKTSSSSGEKKPGSGKLSVPKNGAGAKVQEVKTLGWNESDFENAPSLEELLAMVSDTSKPDSGLRGGSIALDADSVEDLDLRIMAATGTNGEDAYLLKMKLTSWAGDALANQLVELVNSGDPRVTVTSGLFIPENAIDGDKVSFAPSLTNKKAGYKSGYGETYVITLEDGTKVYFMRADAPTKHTSGAAKISQNAPKAYHNKVMIVAPKDKATPESLAAALQTAGVQDVRPSTQDDAKILIENRLMSIFDEKVDPKSNVSGKEREESLQRIKDKWGIGPENITITTGAGGRIEMRLDAESAKKIVDKTKVKVLRHNLTGGSAMQGNTYGETPEEKRERIAAYFVSRVASPQGGLLSTTTRWSEGVPTGGMSSQTDINTGGADYVFTTPGSAPNQKNDSLVPLIYFDAERAFQRLDFWANMSDQFGKRTGKSPIDQAVPGGYEVMFKGRLSFDDAAVLMVQDEDMRTRIITKLRQKGINELGGRPLEAVIMTGPDYWAAKNTTTK